MVLGIGRIVSYSLLLFIGLCNKLFLLKGLIIILTISILLLGRNLLKIDVN